MNDLIKEAREISGKATDGPWQESYFVDKPRYADWSVTQKEYANKYESLAVRGPGVVGSSDCNRVFAFQPDILPEDKAFVIRSRTLVPELSDALEKAEAEFAAYKEANPPRVHGEWVHISEDEQYDTFTGSSKSEFICSECQRKTVVKIRPWNTPVVLPSERFCPACGADMRKEKP